jgi:EpsI family protein
MLKLKSGVRLYAPGVLIPVALILVVQAFAVRRLAIQELNIPIPELHKLPSELAGWRAYGDGVLDPAQAEVLKPDDYIMRSYRNASGGGVDLFVAHFRSLQDSYGPHSPRICLPGAGWLIASSHVGSIQIPGAWKSIPVNEYLLKKSDDRIIVVYWYQNNRAVWADEFMAKLRFFPDLIRYRRSDVSLVRLISPVTETTPDTALARCRMFAQALFPPLADRFSN